MTAKTTMQIECCVCHQNQGEKDGGGQTGITSTICAPCALLHLPEHLHGKFLERQAGGVAA